MGKRRSISLREVFLIVGLLLGCPCRLSALSVTVNDVECVYEFVLYEGDTISGNFVVVDHDIFWSSDHPGIDFIVTSPAGNTVHSLKGTSGDKFEFKAPRAGMYKFCFHNPNRTPETVSFYIHVGHIPNEHDIAKDGRWNALSGAPIHSDPHRSSRPKSLLGAPILKSELGCPGVQHLSPINVKIAQLGEALESVTAEQRYLKAREVRHQHM
ncbi:hypothetical protein ZIOFF_017876 [Zingiber officinale]|uniref:GOLD domain-containing protein n=1 Tax=Zingiber officinale TaxID=94328 RepID=A0A8J5LPV8_ZINOF|nr:hypothetical protein ZIOFF_017876 [Zingiber officinale]